MKIAYLLKDGRLTRLASQQAFPREFFFGFFHLQKLGNEMELFDQDDYLAPFVSKGWISNIWWKFTIWLAAADIASAIRLWRSGGAMRLNDFDVVLAIGPTVTLALGVLKRLRLLKPRVVIPVMGLMVRPAPWQRRAFFRWMLKHVRLCPISKGEEIYLREMLGEKIQIDYLPFGVDTDFWTPIEISPEAALSNASESPYVLSIGNDPKRDYQTLVEAWKPDYPNLKIITNCSINTDKPNIEIIAGSWAKKTFSDEDIRKYYQESQFCVIPLRETIQPSGQSATLQAMACGKAVILTRVAGLWDSEKMRDGENCILSNPNNVKSIQADVESLLQNQKKRKAIEECARITAVEHFSDGIMASALEEMMKRISQEAEKTK